MNQSKVLPQWAPRVKKSKIKKLYELDAKGIYDDELLDEVGYALRSRCQSFVAACQAVSGSAPCPVCDTVISHGWDKEELLICSKCDWQLIWGDYFATIQRKQLSGAEPVLALFQAFVDEFPQAQTEREKMFRIDRLLHGFVMVKSTLNTRHREPALFRRGDLSGPARDCFSGETASQ